MIKFSKYLEEAREYEPSDLDLKSQELMMNISETFKPYTELFLQVYNKKITKEQPYHEIRTLLENKTGQELQELNNLHKMFSTSNCGWDEYHASYIVHYIILELFYPNEKYTTEIHNHIEHAK